MWRSWTSRTPSTRHIASPTSSTSIPRGADSSSTSSGSRIRRHDPSRIRQPIRSAATASASSGPPAAITTPATSAPSEPSASAAEWRRTPSRLRSSRSPRARTNVATRVADQAEGADGRDAGTVHLGRVGQAPDRLDEHPAPRRRRAARRSRTPRRSRRGRRPNVWRPRAGRVAAHAARDAERDRADVRQHVPGVGEQGDRVEQQPAGHRRRQHRHVDGERDRHPAGVAGAQVVVSVVAVHAVSLAHCLR